MQLARFVLVVAASSGALASAGPDLVHEIQGRFHDALLMPRQNTKNLQTFTGALGGIKADAVSAFFLTLVAGDRLCLRLRADGDIRAESRCRIRNWAACPRSQRICGHDSLC